MATTIGITLLFISGLMAIGLVIYCLYILAKNKILKEVKKEHKKILAEARQKAYQMVEQNNKELEKQRVQREIDKNLVE